MIKKYKIAFSIAGAILLCVAIGAVSYIFTHSDKSLNINNVQEKNGIVELAVIGSGPAGWAAAIYGARGGFSTVIFTGAEPGGLLVKTTQIENYPGYISVMGPVLMEMMKKQATNVGVQVINDAVARIDSSTWPYKIETDGGTIIHALAVIVATGATPRKLSIPGEERYWGSGVTSCAICDAPFFKGEDVVVIGGGDSAIEEALQIAPYAKQVTILVRKSTMRAAPSMQERLKGYANIAVRYNVSVQEIKGDDHRITDIQVLNHETKRTEMMHISGVFLAIGHDPNTVLLKNMVRMNAAGYVTVKERTQQTSVPGIFAAGEVEDDYYRQAIVAAGHGASAALDATKFLHDIGWNESLKKQLGAQLFSVKSDKSEEKEPEKQAPKLPAKKVETITTQEAFNRLIQSNELVIVDFFTPSCTLCKQMFPIIESVAKNTNNVSFAKLDTLQVPSIAQQFFIQKVPCMLAFRNGSLVGRYNTIMNEQQLRDTLKQLEIV